MEEHKKAMFEWVDVTGCDAIRDDIEAIFSDESLSTPERIERIDRLKSGYQLLKSETKDKYSRPLMRNGKEFFLSGESIDKIIAYCDATISELQRSKPESLLTFEDMLTIERSEELIQNLDKHLMGTKKSFAYMVIALEKTKVLAPDVKMKGLHKALQNQYSDIGTYDNFMFHLKELKDYTDDKDKVEIELFVNIINSHHT